MTNQKRVLIQYHKILLFHSTQIEVSNMFVLLYRCSVDQDDTLRFIPTNDTRTTKFSLEAFSFVGDNPFVYMHCKVRICNASDPNSRCAQGCIRSRRRRALTEVSPSKDDVAYLAQGPFMREDEKEREADETTKDVRDEDTGGDYSEGMLLKR